MKNTYRSLSLESLQNLARVWMKAHEEGGKTMMDVFAEAGFKGKTKANFFKYRRQAEEILGITLPTLGRLDGNSYNNNWPERTIHIENKEPYTVFITSDHHYMPDHRYPAHDIALKLLKAVKPDYHIINGDALNCGTIGKFSSIGWEFEQPTLVEEYDACKHYTDELKKAWSKAERWWVIGNHCIRFETYLATKAPQMEGMPGTTMDSLFPDWQMCWSMVFNDELMLKHRFHNGVHAARNNTLNGGVPIITGHTHRLSKSPFTDYRGTRFGIEAGTIADPNSIAFRYAEDNPKNWQEGCVVVTISGRDIVPELVPVIRSDQGIYAVFRGKRYDA